MDPKELVHWYKSGSYDLENRELNFILSQASFQGKRVLFIGGYTIIKFLEDVWKGFSLKDYRGISENRELVEYLDDENIIYSKFGCVNKGEFDIILAFWNGLEYKSTFKESLNCFKSLLAKDGVLIIEESNLASEYVSILQRIEKIDVDKKQKHKDEFEKYLKEIFSVHKYMLDTSYDFKSKEKFKDYFKYELEFHENREFGLEASKMLDVIIGEKGNNLKVGEKANFFVCKHK